jgi:Domain of unknown function (DUF4112)
MNEQVTDNSFNQDPELARLEALSKLMDNQYRIPGSNLRFGLDGIIGLIPYMGDMAGFIASGFLMRIMVKKGASPLLMARMLFNYILDAIAGTVPLFGDLFDFGFKANKRNVTLLKKYYADGKVKPNATRSMAFLGIVFFVLFVVLIWLVWKLTALILIWVWSIIHGMI